MKPKLLVVELWGIGDLALACPFIAAAVQKYAVTLVAKPAAGEFPESVLSGIDLLPWEAPWTAFSGKYRLHKWPWRKSISVVSELRSRRFDVAVSARLDPRDHVLLALCGAKRRVGFATRGSRLFLTQAAAELPRQAHRFERWRALAAELELRLPELRSASPRVGHAIVVHTGAGQPVRAWPLSRYAWIVEQLRRRNHVVQVVCDIQQRQWWLDRHESSVLSPKNVTELCEVMGAAKAFVGNDSGPGHVAALLGVPTFTIFGPQLPESFAPIHPLAEWLEGKACDFKPCFDSCRYESPHCLLGITQEEVWQRVNSFVQKHVLAEQTC